MKKHWHFGAYRTWQHSAGTVSCCHNSLHHSPCSTVASCAIAALFIFIACFKCLKDISSLVLQDILQALLLLDLMCYLNLCTLLRLFTSLHCDPIFFWCISHFFCLPPSWILLLSHFKSWSFLESPFCSVYTQKSWSFTLSVFQV